MKLLLLSFFTFSCLFGGEFSEQDQKTGLIRPLTPCNKSKLEGQFTYASTSDSYIHIYRTDNKMMEELRQEGVKIEYTIKWSDGETCDHDLIVNKVETSDKTPEMTKVLLQKEGDILHIKVLEVLEDSFDFEVYQDGEKITDETMLRVSSNR